MADKKKPFREKVAEELIEAISKNKAPWQKPWQAGIVGEAHYNPISNKNYQGINAMWLSLQGDIKGYEDPRWLTFKQAKQLGANVKKGESATKVEYWQWSEKEKYVDENGEEQVREKELERPRVFYAHVFNGSQIEGLEPYEKPEIAFNPIEKAENIIKGVNVEIKHDQNDRCFINLIKILFI